LKNHFGLAVPFRGAIAVAVFGPEVLDGVEDLERREECFEFTGFEIGTQVIIGGSKGVAAHLLPLGCMLLKGRIPGSERGDPEMAQLTEVGINRRDQHRDLLSGKDGNQTEDQDSVVAATGRSKVLECPADGPDREVFMVCQISHACNGDL